MGKKPTNQNFKSKKKIYKVSIQIVSIRQLFNTFNTFFQILKIY